LGYGAILQGCLGVFSSKFGHEGDVLPCLDLALQSVDTLLEELALLPQLVFHTIVLLLVLPQLGPQVPKLIREGLLGLVYHRTRSAVLY
jgi:hypothetical protein